MIHATRRLVLLVLSFALLHSMYTQTMYGQTMTFGATFGQAIQAQTFAKNKNCGQRCSSDAGKVIAAANDFAAHHKDLMPSPDNVRFVAAYIEANQLDPRARKSYEKAYTDLRKEGQLELYSK
jgi:hypothetical protein